MHQAALRIMAALSQVELGRGLSSLLYQMMRVDRYRSNYGVVCPCT